MQHYTKLTYLFHHYGKNLVSRDGRFADCTVRHPGVERPFPVWNAPRGVIFIFIVNSSPVALVSILLPQGFIY